MMMIIGRLRSAQGRRWALLLVALVVDLLHSVLVEKRREAAVAQLHWLQSRNACEPLYGRIGIFIYADQLERYEGTIACWKCYADSRGYEQFVVKPFAEDQRCQRRCGHIVSVFFRRHCVAAVYLDRVDWLLFVDADSFPVNFHRCVEEFIDPDYQIIHYERFFSGEVAAGSYLVRNSDQSRDYLLDWAEQSFVLNQINVHNMDNGVLQLHVLRTVGVDHNRLALCWEKFRNASSLVGYFAFVGCTKRSLLEHRTAAGHSRRSVKVLAPLGGWLRDVWLTGGHWTDRDFVLHDLKRQNAFLKRFVSEPNCPSSADTAGWLWSLGPTKLGYKVSVDTASRLLAKAERRSARYHPDVFFPGASSSLVVSQYDEMRGN
ncbi:hypothetical protein T4B_2872 [Trichinella pseudospiralis]|uniref:Uncharacterized protein n=2 Tax=Trichinella pseudospiralis TaxID=6337 RepID=A0A0V1IGB7_TRIPS|nr:hypothetical protein T4D_15743 [Trichinella pseudospiralis]KRZ21805.1 hypothetical protein T4B_2872 [Trichinella pseudospiralis]